MKDYPEITLSKKEKSLEYGDKVYL